MSTFGVAKTGLMKHQGLISLMAPLGEFDQGTGILNWK